MIRDIEKSLVTIFTVLVLSLGAIIYGAYKTIPVHSSQRVQPHVIVEVLDPSLTVFSDMWRDEIGRRFDNAVGILVHGGDFVEGEWVVGASFTPGHVTRIQDVVRYFQAKYPDRTIILLACNTGHLKLGIPGVYYFKSSVWCVPDRALTAEMLLSDVGRMKFDSGFDGEGYMQTRWQIDPDVNGNIYEAVSE